MASIHAHPDIEYPYTCGFAEQIGGAGAPGSTYCVPLGAGATWDKDYGAALRGIIRRVKEHGAQVMIVSLGVDTLHHDPVAVVGAGFAIELDDYLKIGATLREANIPSIFVQEGGYDMDRLGVAVTNIMRGFCQANNTI